MHRRVLASALRRRLASGRPRAPGAPGYEACDDGNANNGDGCSVDCAFEGCGNGVVDPGEPCDDGNQIDTDACRNGCSLARCGDGIRRTDLVLGQEGYEACDDGNADSGDGCSSGCRGRACGNNVVDPGEACDDGNQDQSDGCTNLCRLAVCGDGHRRIDRVEGQEGYEACDDGNASNDDGCTTSLHARPLRRWAAAAAAWRLVTMVTATT